MYFSSRVQAGRMLASKIVPKHKGEKCVVVALDDGGVVVGAQIAKELHCALTLINSAEIKLPLEPTAVAGITNDGSVAYNDSAYGQGELYEMLIENRGFIEQEKLSRIHELNHYLSGLGTIDRALIADHNLILVSDGLKSGFEIDLAYQYLKPMPYKKVFFAIALASVSVVDRMHVLGDEIFCLDVIDDYMDTDHYYDNRDVPEHSKVISIVQDLVNSWK
jgi:putative phosphoribosyl transferase